MNLLRRSLVVFGAALLLLGSPHISWAKTQSPVNVVKIISFDCGLCYESNTMDRPIKEAVESAGGIFDIAPIPRTSTDWRERFYYVLRNYGPNVERAARDSLFRGSQEFSYPLMDIPEILDWLRQDMKVKGINWQKVVQQVKSPASAIPVERAIRLVAASGARLTPTYVLIRDGKVLAAYDIDSAPHENLSSLRQAVLAGIAKANASGSKG